MNAQNRIHRRRQLLHLLHDPENEAVLLMGIQAGHTAHIHLIGVHAALRVQGQLVDLLLLAQRKVGDHIYPGYLGNNLGEMLYIGQITACPVKICTDGGHTAQNGRARLRLQLLLEGHHKAYMGMGIDDAGQHIQAPGIDLLPAPDGLCGQGHHLAAADAHIQLCAAHFRDDAGAAGDDQVIVGAGRRPSQVPVPVLVSVLVPAPASPAQGWRRPPPDGYCGD